MKQIALDIGLATAPAFSNFFAGPNHVALSHLQLWSGSSLRSPVPTYLWGEPGSGACFRLTLPLVRGHKVTTSPLPLKPLAAERMRQWETAGDRV
jgi:hypothetical protein